MPHRQKLGGPAETGYPRERAGPDEGGLYHIAASMTAAGAVLTRSYGSHSKQRQPSRMSC